MFKLTYRKESYLKKILLTFLFLFTVSSPALSAECIVGETGGNWRSFGKIYSCVPLRSECLYGYTSPDLLHGSRVYSTDPPIGNIRYRYLNYFARCTSSFTRCPFLGGDKAAQTTNPYYLPYTTHFTYYLYTDIWVCNNCLEQYLELVQKCGSEDQVASWDNETCTGKCKETLYPMNNGSPPDTCH